MEFVKGNVVKVIRCESCSQLIGRTAVVKSVLHDGFLQLNFGRGRPNKCRPERFNPNDVELFCPQPEPEKSHA